MLRRIGTYSAELLADLCCAVVLLGFGAMGGLYYLTHSDTAQGCSVGKSYPHYHSGREP